MATTPLRCASCDGELQATSKIYWTLSVAGEWEAVDFADEEFELYCSNDCTDLGLTDDEDRAIRQELRRVVFDVATHHVDAVQQATLSGLFNTPTDIAEIDPNGEEG